MCIGVGVYCVSRGEEPLLFLFIFIPVLTKKHKQKLNDNLERERREFYLDLQLYFDMALLASMVFFASDSKRLLSYFDHNHPTVSITIILVFIAALAATGIYGLIKENTRRYTMIMLRVECILIIIAWAIMKVVYDL